METKNGKCIWCQDGGLLENYHDGEWGTPVHDEYRHFEFLVLESMSCGLSWILMLRKREIFRSCFAGFDFCKVASFGETDVKRILAYPGMIRSQRKIEATVNNACRFIEVQKEWGTFDRYIWSFTGGKTLVYKSHLEGLRETSNELSDRVAEDMKCRHFKYLGSVILYSHLQSIGIINDHPRDCFRYGELLKESDWEMK